MFGAFGPKHVKGTLIRHHTMMTDVGDFVDKCPKPPCETQVRPVEGLLPGTSLPTQSPIHTHTRMRTNTHTHTCEYTHTHTHTRTRTHVNAHKHAHAHGHAQENLRWARTGSAKADPVWFKRGFEEGLLNRKLTSFWLSHTSPIAWEEKGCLHNAQFCKQKGPCFKPPLNWTGPFFNS